MRVWLMLYCFTNAIPQGILIMRISSFQVENYKSFLKSDEINLTSGFNVIVGQNNAGKTALVEALSLRYVNKPHITIQTKPTVNSPLVDLSSSVRVTFDIDGTE